MYNTPSMEKLSKETSVEELLAKYPSLSKTFIEYGLPCMVCGEPFWGTIEELGNQYGKNTIQLVNMLDKALKDTDEKT